MNRIYLQSMKSKFIYLISLILLVAVIIGFFSYKSCKRKDSAPVVHTDTISAVAPPIHNIELPHGDTSLIPVLSKVLDEAFSASAKKDYNQLALLIIYRGPDSLKFGYAVFNARHAYDKTIVRITADVFNKWNSGVEAREYGRVFEMGLPDDRSMQVLEVIFSSKENFDRKFFGFLKIKNEWKIADITSSL